MFYARLSAGSGLMSDSTQQYILAKPISRDRGTDDEDFGGYYIYTGESSDAHAFIYPDGFDELFVPLSVREQQIRDILLDLWEFGYDFAMTDKEKYSKALCVEDAVAAILGLESEK